MAKLLHKPLEYDPIIDGLFIGTNACCITHFELMLLAKGISADLSLEKKHLDLPVGVDYFVWLPVKDHTAPSAEQLRFGVSVIQNWVRLGIKAYIHCHNGHGRAPTLVAAYLIAKGKTAAQAIAYVTSKRRGSHINAAQRRALQHFAKFIRSS